MNQRAKQLADARRLRQERKELENSRPGGVLLDPEPERLDFALDLGLDGLDLLLAERVERIENPEQFESDLRHRWLAGEITQAEADAEHEEFLDAQPTTAATDD